MQARRKAGVSFATFSDGRNFGFSRWLRQPKRPSEDGRYVTGRHLEMGFVTRSLGVTLRNGPPSGDGLREGYSQVKLAASLGSPVPLYFACWGWGHRRRVIFIFGADPVAADAPPAEPDGMSLSSLEAITVLGAVPFSVHCSRAA